MLWENRDTCMCDEYYLTRCEWMNGDIHVLRGEGEFKTSTPCGKYSGNC